MMSCIKKYAAYSKIEMVDMYGINKYGYEYDLTVNTSGCIEAYRTPPNY